MKLFNASLRQSIQLSASHKYKLIPPQTEFEVDEEEGNRILQLQKFITLVEHKNTNDTEYEKLQIEYNILKEENEKLKTQLHILQELVPEDRIERTQLLTEADALGIEYKTNIPTTKLKELISLKKESSQ